MNLKISTVQRVAKNSFWLFLQMGGGKVFSFISVLILARYLGVFRYGELSFAFAFAGFFTVLGNFGLGTYIIKEVSANKKLAEEYFGKGLVIIMVFSLVICLAMILAASFVYSDRYSLFTFYFVGASYLLVQVAAFLNSFFRAYEEMSNMFLTEIVYRVGILVLILICVFLKLDLLYVGALYFVSAVLYLGISVFLVLRYVRPKFSGSFKRYIEILKESFPYGVSAMALIVYYNADIMILSFLTDKESVGLYSASYKLYLSLGLIISIYSAAVFPALSRLFKESPGGIRIAYEKSFKFILLIGLPVAVLTVALSKDLIGLVYGKDYLKAHLPLIVFGFAIPVLYINMFVSNFLNAIDKIRFSLKIFSFACLLNIGLNFILIPRYSYVGAAFATMISEVFYMTIAVIMVKRMKFDFIGIKNFIQILIACAVMSLVGFFFYNQNMILKIALMCFTYAGFIRYFQIINKEDMKIIKSFRFAIYTK